MQPVASWLHHGRGREVQRLLLQAHLDHRGHGDVGPALAVTGPDGVTQRYTHRCLSSRTVTTIFGSVQVERLGYSQPGSPSVYPLDQVLALPARSFSYELQRRLVKAAVLNPFQESVTTIAELTGVAVPKRSAEEIVREAAQDFDAFYQQRLPAPDSGPMLVAAVDCKGIPMVKPESNAPAAPRLTKGQKANRKRMATRGRLHTPTLGTHACASHRESVPQPHQGGVGTAAHSTASGEQARVGQPPKARLP